jgi:hypothetical protein
MNIKDFTTIVDHCRAEHPFWFDRKTDPQANDEQINEAEYLLGVKFPQEYIDFLKEYGGGRFVFTRIFSVFPESIWYVVSRNVGDNSINGFLSISPDGTGGLYGFPVENGICGSEIVYWDHDENYGQGKLVSNNFDNLFLFLIEDGLNT